MTLQLSFDFIELTLFRDAVIPFRDAVIQRLYCNKKRCINKFDTPSKYLSYL